MAARDLILAAVRKKPPVDAAFVYNDEYALIVLQVLRDARYSGYQTTSLSSGATTSTSLRSLQPALTTIELGDLGNQIADHLLAMLEGRRRPNANDRHGDGRAEGICLVLQSGAAVYNPAHVVVAVNSFPN